MRNKLTIILFGLLIAVGWTNALAQQQPTQNLAERLALTLVDNVSVYDPVEQTNTYTNTLQLTQPGNDNPYKFTAGMLNNGDNIITIARQGMKDGANEGSPVDVASINLRAEVTTPVADIVDMIDFYGDGSNIPSSERYITASELAGYGASNPTNWGTSEDGEGLVLQTSGYPYITAVDGLTFTVPDGYSNANMMIYIGVGDDAYYGYFAFQVNQNGWTVTDQVTANDEINFVLSGVNSGDVIAFLGARSTSSGYSLTASPDVSYIVIEYLPSTYIPSVELNPTLSLYNSSNNTWGTATSLGAAATYTTNDAITLTGQVADEFTVVIPADNSHPDSYSYKADIDANVVMPAPGATVSSFTAGIDFSPLNTINITGEGLWQMMEGSGRYYTSSARTSTCAILDYWGSILYTLPDTFMGNQVSVTVTSCTGDNGFGARTLYVNGVPYTFTAGESHTWTVNTGPNGAIEFKSPSDTYSVGISTIVITSGNTSSMNAPVNNNGLKLKMNRLGQEDLKTLEPKPFIDKAPVRINDVKSINLKK